MGSGTPASAFRTAGDEVNAAYDQAFRFTWMRELGLVNDPSDPGGLTKDGFSDMADGVRDEKYFGHDIRTLTVPEEYQMYRERYWVPAWCDRLPTPVDIVHFDFYVNTRPANAIKVLQAACGATPDGEMGPKTLAAALACDARQLAEAMIKGRAEFYTRLAQQKPALRVFLKGWLRRCALLTQEISKGG